MIKEEDQIDYINRFERAIKKAVYQTGVHEREDLEQELYLKIFEKMGQIDFRDEAPNFWDLINEP